MTTYISILRGINVSGHNIIKMAALQELCRGLGFADVQTYIQSGNIVFRYKKTQPEKLSKLLQEGIKNSFGLEVPVISLTLATLQSIAAANPYAKDTSIDITRLHITFLAAAPQPEAIASLNATQFPGEHYEVIGQAVYLFCAKGYGNTKFTNQFFERKLKLTATTRNWKTTLELIKMGEELG